MPVWYPISLQARLLLLIGLSLFLAACQGPEPVAVLSSPTSPPPSKTATHTPPPSATRTAAPTQTATVTPTPTNTATPTVTPTPTITPTPTVSPTPTFDFPDATVQMQAFCRYGPGRAYLPAGDLYAGDHGIVWNRNFNGTWLWVRFDKLWYACWVSASVLEVEGDVFTVVSYNPPLPKSTLYGPPDDVEAARDGDQVVVTWDRVNMTEDDDRGYLIEAQICRDGYLINVAVHTEDHAYTFSDHQNCDRDSSGRLYTVEKHGYTDWVPIPWP